MSAEKKFVIKKDSKTDVVTYMEYERLKGFNVKPKDSVSFEDMINVNEMIIINPTLIDKLVDKKCKRTLEKILKLLAIVTDDDTDDDAPIELILDEIERFRELLRYKYKEYMEEEEYKMLLKKLEIVEKEVELRKKILIEQELNKETKKSGPKK